MVKENMRVADLSSNHLGDINLAFETIMAIPESYNTVKVQLFDGQLYLEDANKPNLSITQVYWIPELSAVAGYRQLQFGVTVCQLSILERLQKGGYLKYIDFFKIARPEATCPELVEEVIKIGFPTIITANNLTYALLEHYLDVAKHNENVEFILATEYNQATILNFSIPLLKEYAGISDHSPEGEWSEYVDAHRMFYYERHVCLRKCLMGAPDADFAQIIELHEDHNIHLNIYGNRRVIHLESTW